MGVIKQGILGGFSGKVAGVIGSSWKGIAVIKAMPLSVSNPRTSGQVLQRTKMANAVALAQAILSTVIKPLWDRFASGMSGYNDFVSTNLSLFTGEHPSPPQNLKISTGKMASTPIVSAIAIDGDFDIQISWTDDSGSGYKLASDLAYAIVINETSNEVSGNLDANTARSTETVVVNVATALAEHDQLRLYLAFKRVDGTIVSESSYLPKTVTS